MKAASILFLIIIFSSDIICQDISDTIFYNSKWEITSKEFASYYRLAQFDPENMCFDGEVEDFYIDGRLQMIGHYSHCKRDGSFVFYHYNKTDSIRINYENGERCGDWFEYGLHNYKECKYLSGSEYVISINSQASDNKIIQGNGNYSDNRIYNTNNKVYSICGEVKDSLKTGKWTIYNSFGKKVMTEYYESGKLSENKLFIKNNEYGYAFLTQNFFVFEVPDKLEITESLVVEKGIKIEANKVLFALKDYTYKKRGLVNKTNKINEYEELKIFLDRKILFNKTELMNYPENDTIMIRFTHNTDYSLSDIELIKPSYSEELNTEIINILKSIDKIILKEQLISPVKIEYPYKLKLPLSSYPELPDKKE